MTLKRKLKHQSDLCAYCGRYLNDWKEKTIDHIKPKSQKGQTKQGNLLVCCQKCNNMKADMSLSQFIKLMAPMTNVRANIKAYLEQFDRLYSRLILDKLRNT